MAGRSWGLLSIAVPKQQMCLSGQVCYKWSWLSCIILVTPYLIWCSTRSQFGDTEAYRAAFQNAPAALGELSAYLTRTTKDQGFSVLTVLIKCIIGNSDKLFFLLIAAFQLFCVVYFFGSIPTIFCFACSCLWLPRTIFPGCSTECGSLLPYVSVYSVWN